MTWAIITTTKKHSNRKGLLLISIALALQNWKWSISSLDVFIFNGCRNKLYTKITDFHCVIKRIIAKDVDYFGTIPIGRYNIHMSKYVYIFFLLPLSTCIPNKTQWKLSETYRIYMNGIASLCIKTTKQTSSTEPYERVEENEEKIKAAHTHGKKRSIRYVCSIYVWSYFYDRTFRLATFDIANAHLPTQSLATQMRNPFIVN